MTRKHLSSIAIVALLLLSIWNAPAPVASQSIDQTVTIDTARSGATETEDTQRQANIVDSLIMIPKLDFTATKLSDALTALARAYHLTLYIDSSVVGEISLRLEDVSLNDALLFMVKQYGLAWEKTGEIIKIHKPTQPEPEPEPLNIRFEEELLSLDIENADIRHFADEVADKTGLNIVIEKTAYGSISGRVSKLRPEKAIQVLATSNGFSYNVVDGIIYLRRETAPDGNTSGSLRSLDIRCENELVTLNVRNSPLSDVLSQLSSQCGANIFIQSDVSGQVTASFENKTVEQTITYLLTNTNFSFKETDGIFFVGPKESEDLYDTRLIQLDNLKASELVEMIPAGLTKQLTVKIATGHNGVVLTGPRTSIAGVEAFVRRVDVPMAQVLFEVIMVDYTSTDRAELGITANNFGGDSGLPGQTYFPMIDISDTGDKLNPKLRSMERRMGISNIGNLSDNFFIRLNMLEQEGKANVRSHPQIAALNGHPAKIEIGTTQYYLLESKTSYINNQGGDPIQTSQRFETIEADMSLEVTPYVNQTGDLTVELKAEFNTPSGTFNPDTPPTINRRTLTSTVRMKEDQTIVLGGLVQNTKNVTIEKLPLLGDIPVLGRIFQNRITDDSKAELMIYMTPHVYYGTEGSINIDSVIQKK